MGDELGSAPGVLMLEWKRAMALQERLLFQRTVFPIGSTGWNRVVHGEARLSGEMLATVGWVDTAGAAPLLGVQAVPAEMDGAVETDGCSRDGPAKLGLLVGVEGSVLTVTDTPESTDAAGAEVVSMEVDVAVDGGECSLVELMGSSVPTAGDGMPVLVTEGVPGSRAVRCRRGRR